MATVLAAIQYLPQIWMTWSLGHVGSLSIPMMLIQTPGSFVWSASLAARLGLEGWSTWGVFLVTGCLQGCLLVMGICFEIKARRERDRALSGVVSGCLLTCVRGVLTLRSRVTRKFVDILLPEGPLSQMMRVARMWRMNEHPLLTVRRKVPRSLLGRFLGNHHGPEILFNRSSFYDACILNEKGFLYG